MSSKSSVKGRGSGQKRREPATKGTAWYLALRRAQAALRKMSPADVEAAIPVLEKYACPSGSAHPADTVRTRDGKPTIDFSTFAEHLETLLSMIDHPACDIHEPDCSALGIFICNKGSKEDKAEALLAIMPVATRVFLRWDEAREAGLEAARAKLKA